MAYPTLSSIYDECRSRLGDDETAGGQTYTDSVLLLPAQSACRELWNNLRNFGAAQVIKDVYYILPANTNVLYPTTAGITDLAAPILIEARGGLTSVTITGATQVASGLQITAVNSFSDGDLITLNGIGGLKGATGIYGISSATGSGFIANGVVTQGTYTSGGVAVKSTDEFGPPITFSNRPFPSSTSNNSRGRITTVRWADARFWFPICTEDMQLHIRYYSSSDVPTSGSDIINVDDSRDFLALWAASIAALGRGATDLASSLRKQAVGSRYDEGEQGGKLRMLMVANIRALQNLPPQERSRRAFSPPMTMWGNSAY